MSKLHLNKPERQLQMEIEFGAEVIDQKGEVLGTIDHIVRDTWSGETKKFVVRREDQDLFLSPDDVAEATNNKVKLKASLEELGKR
jgi:sporulation protein YlmC with PRC-barrel domain